MSKKGKPLSQDDKRRIMGETAKKTGQPIEKDSFPARVQHLVDTATSNPPPRRAQGK